MQRNIHDLVARMSLEEKAGLCSGADFWHTKAVERLEIPAMMVSDGPHGLRTQKEGGGVNDSIRAVCFPAGCATAASFDTELMRREGAAIGAEAQAVGLLTSSAARSAAAILNIIPKTRHWPACWQPPLLKACRARASAHRSSISVRTTRNTAA